MDRSTGYGSTCPTPSYRKVSCTIWFGHLRTDVLDRDIVADARAATEPSQSTTPLPEEAFHNDLLELFAKELAQRGVTLIMISVQAQLDAFPQIRDKVQELESAGLLHYVQTTDWFEDEASLRSPELHLWGAEAHRIIGTELAKIVKTTDFR